MFSDGYPFLLVSQGSLDALNEILKEELLINRFRPKSGFQPRRPLEVIMFTSEEPIRFGISCLGRLPNSRLMAGSEALANSLKEIADGQNISFFDVAKFAGYDIHPEDLRNVFLKKGSYFAFLELHIEQGPILEEEGIPIGIVTAIAAPASIKVEFEGNGGHAGAVLMPASAALALQHDAIKVLEERPMSESDPCPSLMRRSCFIIIIQSSILEMFC